MTAIEYEQELKQNFNNCTYFVRALHKDKSLHIEVEQEKTGYKWKNEFINSYIEEMTSKTGNFKTFDKFCRMIYSALQSSNNATVFIDLLTYQDLEILKARKAAKAGVPPQTTLNATHRTRNKRYLILTYVVEFDRVHYPLALKLDENSIQQHEQRQAHKHKKSHRCATETARRLLSHSAQSSNSSSSASSLTASPHRTTTASNHLRDSHDNENNENMNQHILNQARRSMTSYERSPNQQSDTANANETKSKLNEILQENARLKTMLKEQQERQPVTESEHEEQEEEQEEVVEAKRKTESEYPSDKLTDIIEVLEDEIKILKQELEKKNLEIRRITRSTKQYQQKHIGKRLDEMEDEIERLSTELLQERTKCRRINREFHAERQSLNKKMEAVEASNEHYKRKCRQLKDELTATKQTLEDVRLKASKQRLYSASKSLNGSSSSLRGSRSRSRKTKSTYTKSTPRSYLNRSANANASSSSYQKSRHRPSSNYARYQRSSSAPRFSKNRRSSSVSNASRSRSPSMRFDPTAWAKEKQKKIEQAKMRRNTFGKSRSPSPFRATSRSVSPRDRSKSKRNKRSGNRNRDRSNSRKRNSFGTTISRSPSLRRENSKKRKQKKLPLPRKSTPSVVNVESADESATDLDVLNSMEKRKQRIMSMNHKKRSLGIEQDETTEDVDDDDERSFNPSKEIESIDSRLNALQKFLRAAKSSTILISANLNRCHNTAIASQFC